MSIFTFSIYSSIHFQSHFCQEQFNIKRFTLPHLSNWYQPFPHNKSQSVSDYYQLRLQSFHEQLQLWIFCWFLCSLYNWYRDTHALNLDIYYIIYHLLYCILFINLFFTQYSMVPGHARLEPGQLQRRGQPRERENSTGAFDHWDGQIGRIGMVKWWSLGWSNWSIGQIGHDHCDDETLLLANWWRRTKDDRLMLLSTLYCRGHVVCCSWQKQQLRTQV